MRQVLTEVEMNNQLAIETSHVQLEDNIDPDFDPMYNRFRYGNTFVKGSSVAQQVQDPSAPIDPNFDPMYNRFRYGNTFVKGSSV